MKGFVWLFATVGLAVNLDYVNRLADRAVLGQTDAALVGIALGGVVAASFAGLVLTAIATFVRRREVYRRFPLFLGAVVGAVAAVWATSDPAATAARAEAQWDAISPWRN